MRSELMNPREFVRWWFSSKGYQMRPNGQFLQKNSDVFSTIWLDYSELFSAEMAKAKKKNRALLRANRINRFDLEMAWNEFKPQCLELAIKKFIEPLRFVNEDDSQLDLWLKATVGEFTEMQKAALKQTIWQAKRKMYDMPVVYHITPCFWGKQGGGKTEAIKRLVAPLRELTLEWGINEAVDPRNTKTLSENYICLFDEMAGLARVEIEALKRIISAEYTNFRPMRTNDSVKVKQNCTFIGISNKSLSENIYDSTGLRRFIEFKCLDVLDWDAINKVDATKLWQSINENLERGYLEPHRTEIQEHQESLQVVDEVTHFLTSINIIPEPGKGYAEVTALQLHNYYVMWRVTNGYSANREIPINFFGARLRTFGLEKKLKRIDGVQKPVYYVNPDCEALKPVLTVSLAQKVLEFKK